MHEFPFGETRARTAMMSGSGAELFNRTCFNYPTLGDLYKYATYEAILKRDGRISDEVKSSKS